MLLIGHTSCFLLCVSCQYINSAGTCCAQRQFSLCDMPVSNENIMLWGQNFPGKILSPQHVAWNSAGLSSCILKQGQNDLTCQRYIVCIALADCRIDPLQHRNESISASWACTGTCCSDSFPCVACLFQAKKLWCGDKISQAKFCPCNTWHEISWFEFVHHEAGTKLSQFSMPHRLHCSCKLSPLQHRNEPIFALCAPACLLSLQHASNTYTRRVVFPLHVTATCSLVCVDL